ncbi:MAG: YraN family protein [Anaerolineales bacterium]|nr:MAG: YraN family protein [Anaerolineales bacterium]
MDSSRSTGDYKRDLGRRGEGIATTYLQQQGYIILARNWRCPAGELDIVARDGEKLAFIEVRTRRGDRFGTPEESITPAKQARLVELAQTYLQEACLTDQDWRIDVVAVEMDPLGRLKRLNLIRNAVWAQPD